MARSRPRGRRLESIDDSEAIEPNHPSSGNGSGAEVHLFDLVNGKDPMLIELFE
jgi:hypothetical protein